MFSGPSTAGGVVLPDGIQYTQEDLNTSSFKLGGEGRVSYTQNEGTNMSYTDGGSRASYTQEGANRSSYNPEGMNRSSFNPGGVNRSSYTQDGGNRSSFTPEGVHQSPYPQEGVNRSSFNPEGVNRSSYTQEGQNRSSFTPEGVSRSSYMQEGVNRSSFTPEGVNRSSYTQEGINRSSYTPESGGRVSFTPDVPDGQGDPGTNQTVHANVNGDMNHPMQVHTLQPNDSRMDTEPISPLLGGPVLPPSPVLTTPGVTFTSPAVTEEPSPLVTADTTINTTTISQSSQQANVTQTPGRLQEIL